MNDSRENHAPDIMVPLLAGLAIGFVVGILLAPKSGKETRKDLVEKGEEFMEKSIESFEAAKVKLAVASDVGKEFVEKRRDSFQKVVKSAEDTADKVKKKVDTVIKKGKAAAKKVEDSIY